jgi:hypothetical protein
MAAGYLPVDTPPGTAPMPLGSPVPAKPAAPTSPSVKPPRIPKGPRASGKGRIRKPAMRGGKR